MTFKTSLLVRKCSAIVLNEINLNFCLNCSQQSKSIEIFIALQHFLSNKMDIIIGYYNIKFPESGFSLTLATSQGSPKRSLGNLRTEMSVYLNWPLSIFRCPYHTCRRVHFHVHPLFKASGSERRSRCKWNCIPCLWLRALKTILCLAAHAHLAQISDCPIPPPPI